LIAVAANQRYDFLNNSAVFDTHPNGESLHSLSLPLKRHGGVATFAKDQSPYFPPPDEKCGLTISRKPRLALTLAEQR